MGRRFGAVAIVVASAGAVAVINGGGAGAVTSTPAKTTVPGPGVPATTLLPAVTTLPPTTVWPATTGATVAPPPSTAAPATTTGLTPSVFPSSSPPPATFDAFSFFQEFYRLLPIDPFAAAELADQTVLGSTADSFLLHEVGVAIAIFAHTSEPLPSYVVTPTGPAVTVCRNEINCEGYSNFVLDGALLASFDIDAVPMNDRVSGFERATAVESVTVDASFAVRRPTDELLSVVVLLSAAEVGGATSMAWEQATYVDASGRQFTIDPAASQFPTRIEDGGFEVAHVSFPGAAHDGELAIPFTPDSTGVPTDIRIPLVSR